MPPSAWAQTPGPPGDPAPAALVAPDSPLDTGSPGLTRNAGAPAEVGDPISAGSGGYHFAMPLLRVRGPLALEFSLIYNTNLSYLGSPKVPYRFYWSPFTAGKYDNMT